MDPFGDDQQVNGEVPTDISDFAPPSENANDFYEVEPTEATSNEAYEEQTEAHYQENYESMDFAPQEPVETPTDFSAGIPAPMDIPAQIPAVEEDNELTRFMHEYEEKIALKAQEQEKVAVECKSKAEDDMAQFLAERQRIKESKMQSNRVFEQATLEKMVADLQNENPWERVVTLVDLETSRKKKLDSLKKDDKKQDQKPVAVPAKKTAEDEEDVTRMRQLFVQLKTTPLEQTRADAVAAN